MDEERIEQKNLQTVFQLLPRSFGELLEDLRL